MEEMINRPAAHPTEIPNIFPVRFLLLLEESSESDTAKGARRSSQYEIFD